MRAFICDRRRISGCIALSIACALSAIWLRSFVVEDSVSFVMKDRQYQALSLHGNACLWWWDRETSSPIVGWQQTIFEPGPFNSERAWRRKQTDRDLMDRIGIFRDGFAIPYSVLVLFLVLVSAYCIWTSRRSMQIAPLESIESQTPVGNLR